MGMVVLRGCAASLASCMLLAGCGGDRAPSQATTSTTASASPTRPDALPRAQVLSAIRRFGGPGRWIQVQVPSDAGIAMASYDTPLRGRVVVIDPKAGYAIFPFSGGCASGSFRLMDGVSAPKDRMPAARPETKPSVPPLLQRGCGDAVAAKGAPQAAVALLRRISTPVMAVAPSDADPRLSAEAMRHSKDYARRHAAGKP